MCVTRIRMCEVYAQCMYHRKMCVQKVSVCTVYTTIPDEVAQTRPADLQTRS